MEMGYDIEFIFAFLIHLILFQLDKVWGKSAPSFCHSGAPLVYCPGVETSCNNKGLGRMPLNIIMPVSRNEKYIHINQLLLWTF
jgi:hypothetical protein